MNLRTRLPENIGTILGVAVIGLLFLLAYRDTLGLLTTYWASNDMYSYGFLVPVISALMFWLRRHELPVTPVAPSVLGGSLVTFAGLTALQFGRSSATNLIQEMSLVITVVGLTLLVLGWQFFRRFWFPLAYLLAMVPFWDFLTRGLQPFFQRYSAVVGVWLVGLIGIPVLREGNFIQLPNIRLEVAEACSGINHLVAVMCIGVPATLLLLKSWRRRLFVLLSAAGIALASNGLRVAIVCWFAYNGVRAADGNVHGPYAVFRSLVISGVGFLALFALISYFADKETPWRPSSVPAVGPPARPLWRVPRFALVVAVALLCSSLALQQWHRNVSVPPGRSLAGFPAHLGRWSTMGPAGFGPAFEAIRFDDRLSCDYRTPDGRMLNLRIGYFRHQAQGKKLAGWDMSRVFADGTNLPPALHLSALRAKELIQPGPTGRMHVTYWYLVAGTTLGEDYQVRLLTGFRSLFLGRSSGALLVVSRQLGETEGIDASRAVVRDFIEAVMPVVRVYLPEA